MDGEGLIGMKVATTDVSQSIANKSRKMQHTYGCQLEDRDPSSFFLLLSF